MKAMVAEMSSNIIATLPQGDKVGLLPFANSISMILELTPVIISGRGGG